jgi:hypothetical protein
MRQSRSHPPARDLFGPRLVMTGPEMSRTSLVTGGKDMTTDLDRARASLGGDAALEQWFDRQFTRKMAE